VGGLLVASATAIFIWGFGSTAQPIDDLHGPGAREAVFQVEHPSASEPALIRGKDFETRARQNLGLSTVLVVEASGSPVAGAKLIPATTEGDAVLRSKRAVAESSSAGMIQIDPKGLVRSYYVYGEGFVPTIVRDLSAGQERRVALTRAAMQDFRFETVEGAPVQGISATVSSRSLTSRESRVAGEGQFISSPGETGLVASTGLSDAIGRAKLSLTVPGTYWLRINLDDSGYILSNTTKCVQVTIPSPVKVVQVREIIGTAINFIGADIVAIRRSRNGPSPFDKSRPVPEMVPVKNAKERLQKKFGNARVLLGVRKDGNQPLGNLELLILKRSGETERVAVPLQRLPDIKKPQVVKLKKVPMGQTCLVTFRYSQTGIGKLAANELPKIKVRILRDGERFTVQCREGEPVVLPRGELYVIPEKNVLDAGFATQKLDLKSVQREIVLPLEARLYRYNIRILLPNGKMPQRCSIGIRRTMYGRKASSSIYVLDGSITFWTARAELKVKVDTRGCKSLQTVLKAGATVKLDGEKIHLVQMASDS